MHRFQDSELLIRDQGHALEPIYIEDDVWIGSACGCYAGCSIGTRLRNWSWSRWFTKSVKSNAVIVGVPAERVLKVRGQFLIECVWIPETRLVWVIVYSLAGYRSGNMRASGLDINRIKGLASRP